MPPRQLSVEEARALGLEPQATPRGRPLSVEEARALGLGPPDRYAGVEPLDLGRIMFAPPPTDDEIVAAVSPLRNPFAPPVTAPAAIFDLAPQTPDQRLAMMTTAAANTTDEDIARQAADQVAITQAQQGPALGTVPGRLSSSARDMWNYGPPAAVRAGVQWLDENAPWGNSGLGAEMADDERRRRQEHAAAWRGREFWNTDEIDLWYGGPTVTGPAASFIAGAADISGGIAGAVPDPTNWIGAGRNLLTRVTTNAAAAAAADTAYQSADIYTGVEDEFSPERLALTTAAGGVLPAVFHVLTHQRPGYVDTFNREYQTNDTFRAAVDAAGIRPDRNGNFSEGAVERAVRDRRFMGSIRGSGTRNPAAGNPDMAVASQRAMDRPDVADVMQARGQRLDDTTLYEATVAELDTLARANLPEGEVPTAETLAQIATRVAERERKQRVNQLFPLDEGGTRLRRKKNETEAQFRRRVADVARRRQETQVRDAQEAANLAGEQFPPARPPLPAQAVEQDLYTYKGQSYSRAPTGQEPEGYVTVRRYDRDTGRLSDEYIVVREQDLTSNRDGGAFVRDQGAEVGQAAVKDADAEAREAARGVFGQVQRQRERIQTPDTRDTQPAPFRNEEAPRDVVLARVEGQDYPVRVLGQGAEPDTVRVEAYDPRTGKVSGEPFDVPTSVLTTRPWTPEGRRSQDFEERAQGPLNPERPRAADAPVDREPDQTYRVTQPDDEPASDPYTGRPPTPEGPTGPRDPEGGDPLTARASRGADDAASSAEDLAAQEARNAQARAEWEARRRASRPEQTQAGEGKGPFRSAEDVADDYRARQRKRRGQGATPEEDAASARYHGTQSTADAYGTKDDGDYVTDNWGYVVSRGRTGEPAGPIKFKRMRDAAEWIVRNTQNTSEYTRYYVDRHPDNTPSFTVRAEDVVGKKRPEPAPPRQIGPTARAGLDETEEALLRDAETGTPPVGSTSTVGARVKIPPATDQRTTMPPGEATPRPDALADAPRAGPIPPAAKEADPVADAIAQSAKATTEMAAAVRDAVDAMKDALAVSRDRNIADAQGEIQARLREAQAAAAAKGTDEVQPRAEEPAPRVDTEDPRRVRDFTEEEETDFARRLDEDAVNEAYTARGADVIDIAARAGEGSETFKRAATILDALEALRTAELEAVRARKAGRLSDAEDLDLTRARRKMRVTLESFGIEVRGRNPGNQTNVIAGPIIPRPTALDGAATSRDVARMLGETRDRNDGPAVAREVDIVKEGDSVAFITPDGRAVAPVKDAPDNAVVQRMVSAADPRYNHTRGPANFANKNLLVRVNGDRLADGTYPLFEVPKGHRLSSNQTYMLLRHIDSAIARHPDREWSVVVGGVAHRVKDNLSAIDLAIGFNHTLPRSYMQQTYGIGPEAYPSARDTFFGESVLRDDAGEPQVLYSVHDQPYAFERLSSFSTGGQRKPFIARIEKPLELSTTEFGGKWPTIHDLIRRLSRGDEVDFEVRAVHRGKVPTAIVSDLQASLQRAGYDGVIVRDANDRARFIAYPARPEQTKSTANRGSFDDMNPNALYSFGPDALRDLIRRMNLPGLKGRDIDVAMRHINRTAGDMVRAYKKMPGLTDAQRAVLDELVSEEGIRDPNKITDGMEAIRDFFFAGDIITVQRWADRTAHVKIDDELGQIVGVEHIGKPALRVLADRLGSDPASGRVVALPYEHRMTQEIGRRANRVEEILAGLSKQELSNALEGVWGWRSVLSPREQRAVNAVRTFMRDHLKYMRDAGLTVGDRGPTYHARPLNPVAVEADQEGFIRAATNAYLDAGIHTDRGSAEAAAKAWFDNIVYGPSSRSSSFALYGNGNPNPVKNRVLPDNAARHLLPYYEKDMRSILGRYIQSTVQQAEFTRFFGKNGEVITGVLDAVRTHVPAEVHARIGAAVNAILGRSLANEDPAWRRTVGWIKTTGTIRILLKSALASIVDPLNVGVRTGRLRDSLATVAQSVVELANPVVRGALRQGPSYGDRLARVVGLIGRAASDMMNESRLLRADTPLQQAALNAYFEGNGLRYLTERQRVAAATVGEGILRDFLRNVDDKSGAWRAEQDVLSDYGIAPTMVARMRDYADRLEGMSEDARIREIAEGDSAEAGLYRQALYGHVVRTLVSPTNADTARVSKVPYLRNMYSLASFPFTFTREILLGALGKNLFSRRGAFGQGLSVADRARKLGSLSAYLTMMGGVLAVHHGIRQQLTDSKRSEEQTPDQYGLEMLSRMNLLGTLDQWVNLLYGGARYDRSLSSILAGPAIGSQLDSLSEMIQGIPGMPNNSEETNNAEWMGVRHAFQSMAVPAAVALLNAAPLPIAARAAVGGALGSSDTAYGVADAVVGERDVKPGREPERDDVFDTGEDLFDEPEDADQPLFFERGAVDPWMYPSSQEMAIAVRDAQSRGGDADDLDADGEPDYVERALPLLNMFPPGDVNTDAMTPSENVLNLVPNQDEPPNMLERPYGRSDIDIRNFDLSQGVRTINVGGRFYNVPARDDRGRRFSDDEIRSRLMQNTYPYIGVYPRESTARQAIPTYEDTYRTRTRGWSRDEVLRGRDDIWGRRVNIDERYRD